MDGQQWFCARHQAASARWALLNLKNQGFVAHWPTFRERIVRRHRVIFVQRPVFPGYVFVWFSLADRRYVAINSTSGIVHLLPIRGERPAPLPAGFVEALQTRALIAPVIAEVIQTFSQHGIVKILAGAFAGKQGRVVASGAKATRLTTEAFGRETLLTVATGDLAAVPAGLSPRAAASQK